MKECGNSWDEQQLAQGYFFDRQKNVGYAWTA